MLAILEDGLEVLICEVDSEGQPIFADYFNDDKRNRDEYDTRLVEAPIRIERGTMRVEPERNL